MSSNNAYNGKLEGHNNEQNESIHPVQTGASITISREMFEKLYLSPENNVKGDLRKTFGNPTPL